RGTLHWVSAAHCVRAEVRLYDHLFIKENPSDENDFKELLNPDSLKTLTSCRVENCLKNAGPGSRYQFLRQGYFCVDPDSSSGPALVFNRTVSLRDTWAKIEKAMKNG
ncbi:MAG: glutamine--tRNA ligase, partial [Spirochaetes bacterium]|nr:glutamine--tRNA ligase [Spirochaetota bacterium]